MNRNGLLKHLSDDVYILNSPFVESKRGLLVDAAGSVLIDTSVALAETQLMLDKAISEGHPVRRVVLTHSHFDHSAGCQLVPQVERIAHDGAGKWMLSQHAQNYLALRPAEHPDLERVQITLPTLEIAGEATLRLHQRTLHLFPTPGHSPDSMAILLQPGGILFAGDAVVTCFPPIIQDGNSSAAIASLKHILELDFAWLVPGHGPLLDTSAAQAHCRTSLRYLQEITTRLLCFDDPDTPLGTIMDATADLRSMWPFADAVLDIWHPKAVSKIWDERRQRIQNMAGVSKSS